MRFRNRVRRWVLTVAVAVSLLSGSACDSGGEYSGVLVAEGRVLIPATSWLVADVNRDHSDEVYLLDAHGGHVMILEDRKPITNLRTENIREVIPVYRCVKAFRFIRVTPAEDKTRSFTA